MCSLLRKLLLVSTLMLSVANASDHGDAKAEAKPEAKSEAKDEYTEVLGKVGILQAKIKTNKEIVQSLIEEKQHEKESSRVAEIIKNLVSEHKSMQKNIDEYEKARSYLQYRFPEKGLKGKRTYERFEQKSLEEIEHEMTMENRLKKTLNKVRKQYDSPVSVEKEVNQSKSRKRKLEPKTDISEPVILSK